MSYQIPIGAVVRYCCYSTIPGQTSVNRRDYQLTSLTGGVSVGSFTTLQTIDAAIRAVLQPLLANDATIYGAQMYLQTPTPPAPRPESNIDPIQGLAGDGLLPTQTAGLISLYSNDLGRSGQGRIYVPFPTVEDQAADGTPIASYVTRLGALNTQLVTPIAVLDGAITATFSPVLYVPGGAPPKIIAYGIPRDAWATQRRRGSFGRVNGPPF